jgi:replicative DNA helicase
MLSGGVGKGEFIIIAGRPAMGKTGIAVNIAENIALGVGQRDKYNKKAVVIFSLEMTKESLVDRIIAGQIKLNSYQLRTGNFDSNIDEKLDAIVTKFNDTNFYCFDGGNLGINSIRNELRKLITKEIEIGCIIIDYLQLMEEKDLNRNSNREQEISKLSRGLKLLSKELNTPVIALSQLSRNVETRANKRPQLSDLRESGSLEQDTDIVMFIYRDEYYNTESVKKGTAEVIVAKQRNGSIGTVELNFNSTLVKFNSLEEFGV